MNFRMPALLLLFAFSINISAQFSLEWSSNSTQSFNTMGWLDFNKNGDNWEARLFKIDYNSFSIMSSQYSNSVQYKYDFSDPERSAGYQMYSLEIDLTGDGIVEFYTMANFDSEDNPRQTIKIFDITNGNILFEKDNASYSFSYPTIWDIDNDGVLELSFVKYDYPNLSNYIYEVYSTGVIAGQKSETARNLTFVLEQNFPNPFNPETTIQYSLNKPANIKVDIFDINGRVVNQLVNGHRNAGSHKVIWNGKNKKGNQVSSGTYFYRITNNNTVQTKKMLVLK